jgi:virginiamycin B lyase
VKRRVPVALAAVALAAAVVLIAAPAAGAFVYWANEGGSSIGRANTDGSATDQDFIPAAGPCGVAVDSAHIYWGGNAVGRADIDGTDDVPGFIATGPSSDVCGVAVDPGHVYWSDQAGDTIGRADIDGTVPPGGLSFISGPEVGAACGVAVNDANLFWSNQTTQLIRSAPLAGGAVLPGGIATSGQACGVAVNSAHVYWADFDANAIGRANLDGSAADPDFISGAHLPCGIAVDDSHIYWANSETDTIGRADLNGEDANESFISTGSTPCGVAVDDGRRNTSTVAQCVPAQAAVAQPTTCAVTVTDSDTGATLNPEGGVTFATASTGTFSPAPSCTLNAMFGAPTCFVQYLPPAGTSLVLATYEGDARHDPSSAVAQVDASGFTVAPAVVGNDGTATVLADLPGPGHVDLGGTGVVPKAADANAAGPVTLPITPDAASLAALAQTGQANVLISLHFAPSGGGSAGAATQAVRLIKPLPFVPTPPPPVTKCGKHRRLKKGRCVKRHKRKRHSKHR